MSAPVRFLSVAIISWAMIRATTLGALPGFSVGYAKPAPPAPIVATDLRSSFVDGDTLGRDGDWPGQTNFAISESAYARSAEQPVRYYRSQFSPVPSYAIAPTAPRATWSLASLAVGRNEQLVAAPAHYSELPPIIREAGVPQRSIPIQQAVTGRTKPKLDRWQMSSWALLRGAPAPGALANAGTLGGSQAGARVTYAFTRRLAASVRATSPIGGSRGAEVAAGLRWSPLRSVPVALTVERRQSISPHGGGRSDFALFAEGGVYKRPMPWRFQLDAYVQAGIVGLTRRDMFVDGAFAFTRPVYKNFSAGFGMWGGYQPGLYRLDAGPRVSMRVRDNISVHADWRQRVAGNALPSSGPALTLSADF